MKLLTGLLLAAALTEPAFGQTTRGQLDPRGERHLPIGTVNTVDPLKTFVEAEGNFSPGFGTFGVYFWVWDELTRQLTAPTMDGVPCAHGLGPHGALTPWTRWQAGPVEVTTEVAQAQRPATTNFFQVVGARVHLTNRSPAEARVALYAAVRPLGAAGGPITNIGFSEVLDTLALNNWPALIANQRAQAAGALPTDTIGDWAQRGDLPKEQFPKSPDGDCSGALRFTLTLAPGAGRTLGFTLPVYPARHAPGHRWADATAGAPLDLNTPTTTNGALQLYAGLGVYRRNKAELIFSEATAYWHELTGRVRLTLPDPRWAESFAAIVGHTALCLNEGAPDGAVINENVSPRDAVALANVWQKAGRPELAALAIDHCLSHPFRSHRPPMADSPGSILWLMGEHWQFTRDPAWLSRVYPAAQKIAALIRYYRTTPGPHYVADASFDFGATLPANARRELKPGAGAGFHSADTAAFDLAGLRGAITLAEALGRHEDAASWRKLAEELFAQSAATFTAQLAQDNGHSTVLWPCRVYPLSNGPAFAAFSTIGAQPPGRPRALPLARAHQGLLAGQRAAGAGTLQAHLDHPQMQGWYALDAGGDAGVGGWNHVRTRWPRGPVSVAQPHGRASAEFLLLLRDALAFEEGERLVLFAGVPGAWFQQRTGMKVENLPTHFGSATLAWAVEGKQATLTLSGAANPPGGYVLRLPPEPKWQLTAEGQAVTGHSGDFALPRGTRRALITWE